MYSVGVKEGAKEAISTTKEATGASSGATEPGAFIEAPPPPGSSRVGVTKLLKPQEVEVGIEKPKFSSSDELDIDPNEFFLHPSTQHPRTLQSIRESPGAKIPSMAVGVSPTTPMLRTEQGAVPSKVVTDLEAKGYHRVEGGGKYTTTHVGRKEEEEYPRELTQGDRVKVARMGGGPIQGQTREAYARPDYEVAPLGAGEVAGMKAKEHDIVAKEASKRAEMKHAELMQLRRQAKQLEEQSTQLMHEAEPEKQRVEAAHERMEEIQHVSLFFYILLIVIPNFKYREKSQFKNLFFTGNVSFGGQTHSDIYISFLSLHFSSFLLLKVAKLMKIVSKISILVLL